MIISLKVKSDIEILESKLNLQDILSKCPKTIPDNLIKDLKEWRIC